MKRLLLLLLLIPCLLQAQVGIIRKQLPSTVFNQTIPFGSLILIESTNLVYSVKKLTGLKADSALSNYILNSDYQIVNKTVFDNYLYKPGIAGGQTTIGGTAVTDVLKLQGTTGNGTATSPAVQFLTGNSGATVAGTILNNGNVGIGTTGPIRMLTIAGATSAILLDGTNSLIDIDRGSTSSAGETRYLTAGVQKWYTGISNDVVAGDGGEFFIGQSAGGQNANLWIETNGNVGISTTAPFYKIDIAGALRLQSTNKLRFGGTTGVGTDYLFASATGTIETASVLKSTVTTGTAPFVIASTTVNANLNSEFLQGHHADYFQTALTNPVTGTGATGQVAFWNGTSTQTGDNGLFWDNTNKRFGVETVTPIANFQVNQTITGIGTVSNSAGGTAVTGVGTQFLNTFKVGDSITIGGQTVAITAVLTDTTLTTGAITNLNSGVAYSLIGGNRFGVYGNGNVGIGIDSKFILGDFIGDKFNWIKNDYSNSLTWGAEAFVLGASASGFVFTNGEDNTPLAWLNSTGLGIGTVPSEQIHITGKFKSELATGTAPFEIDSKTTVVNLSCDSLDGFDQNHIIADSLKGFTTSSYEKVIYYSRLAANDTTRSYGTADPITGFTTGTLAAGTYIYEVVINHSLGTINANSCFIVIDHGNQTNQSCTYTYSPDGSKYDAEISTEVQTTGSISTNYMTAMASTGTGTGSIIIHGTITTNAAGQIRVNQVLTADPTLGVGLVCLKYSTFKVTQIQ